MDEIKTYYFDEVQDRCTDGVAGFFHVDESVDAIRVETLDGSPFAVGKGIEITVDAWAYADYSADALDLYVARDATAPEWQYVTTLHPEAAGEQVLTFRHTLGEGSLQAIRAALRFGGSAAACSDGIYDDRDDIVFAVGAGTPDDTNPTVSLTEPGAGDVLGGETTLSAVATDDSGVVNRVELLVDGNVVATATAPNENTDQFDASWNAASVADGSHLIVARAVDGAGNVATSAAVTFQVADIVAPTIAIVSPEADDSVGSVVTIVTDAQDDRAVSRVSFYAGGVLVGERTAAPWSFDWSTAPRTGNVVLTASVRDAAGHVTASAPVTVFVDRVAPTVSLTSPADGDVVSSTVTFAADIDDNRGMANITRVEFLANDEVIATDDRLYPTAPCTAAWRTGSYPDGSYEIVAKAYDAAGNVGTSDAITVEVDDATPPTLTIVTPEDGSTIRLIAEVTAVATDDGLMDRVEMSLGSTPLDMPAAPPWTVLLDTVAEGLADGEYQLSATAYDAAGNSTTAESTVWVDNTAPAVQLTAPAAAADVSGTYALRATATDNQTVDHVEFYVGSAVLATDTAAPFEADWDTTGFDNGTYEVGAIAYDAAGNANTSAIVQLTVWNPSTTDYDPVRNVPACATVATFCFSGTLLDSRAAIVPVPEAHAPNTLDGCEDGTFGEYHVDESIDRIKVSTTDGTNLAPGKTVEVEVDFFVVSPDFDRVDLYYAADATAPAWVLIDTAVPAASGLQMMTKSYTLPAGPLQAIRAAGRYAENGPRTCAPGSYDDHDDIVFAVETPGTDSTLPTVSIQNPVDGGTVHGSVLVNANATDDRGVARVELTIDGAVVATDAVAPYEFEWDSSSVTDGSHRINAIAYDTSGNDRTSNPVFVTVAAAANAQYDATRMAPACAATASFCDTGDLVEGRGLVGPEQNAPNTLAASCQDGGLGTYLQEESIERIALRTDDGRALTPGNEGRIEVTVFASSAYGADALDLYSATTSAWPSWHHVATLLPSRAGLQVLSTVYRVPPGAQQALRARFRYGGVEGPCGAGGYDDHDDLAFAVPFSANASRDATLKVPRCTDGRFYCDSGVLLDGRAGLGPEAHAPNTLREACADGAAGTYHVDPSIDAIRVYSADATPLASGQTVVAEVQIFASDTFEDEAIDVYICDDAVATSPTWTWMATLMPIASGVQTLAAELTLGSGSVQAIRASHRAAADAAVACSAGVNDDHDDLAFNVLPPVAALTVGP